MNFQTICRVCVANNLEMVSILEPYNFSIDSCEIFKVIMDCASVQVQKCDGFSEKICLGCLDDLSRAYRFKKLCEDSDYKFRNNLIVSNEILIKNEFNEEDAVISYGEIHKHINTTTNEKSEITYFGFTEVKQEQHIVEIRTQAEANREQDEAVKAEQEASRLCSRINRECEEQSSLKTKSYKCDVCEKTFSKKDNLVKHHRLHSGEKPFKCKICGKTFTQSSNLNVHIRLHTGEKCYDCDFCEKKFANHSNLTRHISLHKGEKQFSCRFCEKSFTTQSNLIRHIRLHKREQLYKCEFCAKKFTDSSNLVSHIRTHTGEKPYECNFCQKKFSQSCSLTNHITRLLLEIFSEVKMFFFTSSH